MPLSTIEEQIDTKLPCADFALTKPEKYALYLINKGIEYVRDNGDPRYFMTHNKLHKILFYSQMVAIYNFGIECPLFTQDIRVHICGFMVDNGVKIDGYAPGALARITMWFNGFGPYTKMDISGFDSLLPDGKVAVSKGAKELLDYYFLEFGSLTDDEITTMNVMTSLFQEYKDTIYDDKDNPVSKEKLSDFAIKLFGEWDGAPLDSKMLGEEAAEWITL
ncbi:MAG: hypothetical protein LBT88_04520 [Oscillospiraceae bacterium]|jgi:hypothetical protein|nr:hypothetical protein [Oscillospiraceae bacterium]